MNWKPNKWVAVALTIFLQPLGLLYVARPFWAVLYFLIALGVVFAKIALPTHDGQSIALDLTLSGVLIVAAVYAYRVASRAAETTSRPAYTRWYGLATTLLGLWAATVLIRTFIVEPFRMPAASMAPSLPSGTYILVNKWGYGHYGTYGVRAFSTPISKPLSRGDVIVFDYPENPELTFIKRLVGLPGDKVVYRDKRLAINGVAVPTTDTGTTWDSDAGRAKYKIFTEQLGALPHNIMVDEDAPSLRLHGVRNYPQRDKCTYDESGFACDIPAGQYFVMGDSRDNSDDSRYWGFVPASAIIGKVSHAFVPR